MGDTVNFPISLDSDLGRELIVDCVRFAEGLLDERAVRKKYRFDDSAWDALGDNDELVEKIEAEKISRIRNGDSKREKAQALIVKAPDILDGIMNDPAASPRHRVDAIRTLDNFAANAPGASRSGRQIFDCYKSRSGPPVEVRQEPRGRRQRPRSLQ